MTEFEMKVKEALKPFDEICDVLVSCTKSELTKGIENVDSSELEKVTDSIMDMCKSKYYITEAMYKCEIGKAMEENAEDYGKTWDAEGRKAYTRMRDSKGRYMYTEPMKEPMMNDSKVRYYTEPVNGSHSSRMGYMETKEAHKGNTSEDIKARMHKLEKYLDDMEKEVDEMTKDMTPEEKTMMHTRFNRMSNK